MSTMTITNEMRRDAFAKAVFALASRRIDDEARNASRIAGLAMLATNVFRLSKLIREVGQEKKGTSEIREMGSLLSLSRQMLANILPKCGVRVEMADGSVLVAKLNNADTAYSYVVVAKEQ